MLLFPPISLFGSTRYLWPTKTIWGPIFSLMEVYNDGHKMDYALLSMQYATLLIVTFFMHLVLDDEKIESNTESGSE